MTRFFASLSLGAALLSLTVATPVLAADTVVVTSASTTTAPIEGSGPLPNRFLLRSGMFTLGAAYVPALVVAIESERTEDNHLNSDGSPALAVSVAPAHLGRGANGAMAVGRF